MLEVNNETRLSLVYKAVNKEAAGEAFLELERERGERYPVITRLLRKNREKLTEYCQFTPEIRRVIYTTNIVEGYYRQIRKGTKNRGIFSPDTALEKLFYLAYRSTRKK
jgi:transposase-like protein